MKSAPFIDSIFFHIQSSLYIISSFPIFVDSILEMTVADIELNESSNHISVSESGVRVFELLLGMDEIKIVTEDGYKLPVL